MTKFEVYQALDAARNVLAYLEALDRTVWLAAHPGYHPEPVPASKISESAGRTVTALKRLYDSYQALERA